MQAEEQISKFLLIRNGEDMGYHFLLPIRYVICIFINKQVDIYSLAKLQIKD
ncbi:Uncharacterised protein [Segatella copri]|nr:Uncharacterised protein [Segatella copri]